VILLLVFAGLLGLAIGSFLNVVIYRVPAGLSVVSPASRCPSCESPIRARHNVPVAGWLVLRGRCADCREPISLRSPLVEAGTATLFVALTVHFGAVPVLPGYLYLGAVALALAFIDVQVHRLPDVIVLPSYLVCAALLLPAALLTGGWAAVVRAVAAMAALWLFYFALAWLRPGGMGFGDVKLAGLLGLCLGALGWTTVLVGTASGFLLGGALGAVLLIGRRAGRRSAIPFGPAMLAGALVAVFAAAPIASWYRSLLLPPA
jgi:leader peptidase (prepilin peptidase)/N-methyltransferase